jgi:hypothetical protein
VEKNGVIRSMTRKARVLFSQDSIVPSFLALSAALDACPASGSTLADLGYDALVLTERSPAVAENDPACVDVTLKYEHILDGPNQSLFNNPKGIIFGKGRCSITEKTTNFFYPDGDPTAGRVQILVAHTFEKNDRSAVAQFLKTNIPLTGIQSGEVSIPFPQANFHCQGTMFTDNPMGIGQAFIACINDDTWFGYPARTWICSEVQWEVLSPAQKLYRFSFEFQYNIDTWDPTVVFNDQRTGRPPAGVLPATLSDPGIPGASFLSYRQNAVSVAPVVQPAGFWQVPALRRVDFNEMFASFFEGVVPPVGG